jgi:hypothetical protein
MLRGVCVGTFQGKEGGIQVLAGLAQSSQTVGSLFRVMSKQSEAHERQKRTQI